MPLESLSPVLVVDEIEPCLPFWERFGFQRVAEVPHEDALGFVMLQKDGVTVMYQTRASVRADVPALAEGPYRSCLYLRVSDLEAIAELLNDDEIVVPRRTTFYGATEIFVRDPAGHFIGFAQFAEGS